MDLKNIVNVRDSATLSPLSMHPSEQHALFESSEHHASFEASEQPMSSSSLTFARQKLTSWLKHVSSIQSRETFCSDENLDLTGNFADCEAERHLERKDAIPTEICALEPLVIRQFSSHNVVDSSIAHAGDRPENASANDVVDETQLSMPAVTFLDMLRRAVTGLLQSWMALLLLWERETTTISPNSPGINVRAIPEFRGRLLRSLRRQRSQILARVLKHCCFSKDIANIVSEYAINVCYRLVQQFFCALMFCNRDLPFAFQRRLCKWNVGESVPGNFWLPPVGHIVEAR